MKRLRGKAYVRSIAVIGIFAAALAACSAGQDAPPPGHARLTARAGKVHHALLTVPAREAPAPPGAM